LNADRTRPRSRIAGEVLARARPQVAKIATKRGRVPWPSDVVVDVDLVVNFDVDGGVDGDVTL
jgi:hypothetical protein